MNIRSVWTNGSHQGESLQLGVTLSDDREKEIETSIVTDISLWLTSRDTSNFEPDKQEVRTFPCSVDVNITSQRDRFRLSSPSALVMLRLVEVSRGANLPHRYWRVETNPRVSFWRGSDDKKHKLCSRLTIANDRRRSTWDPYFELFRFTSSGILTSLCSI